VKALLFRALLLANLAIAFRIGASAPTPDASRVDLRLPKG
jgi:hypothetical protein